MYSFVAVCSDFHLAMVVAFVVKARGLQKLKL